jgi:MscS family membrane protein
MMIDLPYISIGHKKLYYVIVVFLSLFCLEVRPLYAQDPEGTPTTTTIDTTDTTDAETTDSIAQVEDARQGDDVKRLWSDIEWHITVGKVLWALVIFSMGLFTIKYLTGTLERMSEPRTNLRLTIKRLIPVIRIVGWTMVFYIIIIDVFAPSMQTLIAVSASAGIAVGFASQDVLKNVFGGFTILLDRPFQVGDKIEVGSYYGEVTQIGLRSVRIVTPDDSQVSIPNGEIMNQSVSNANVGESNCQVVPEFFLPPDIDLVRAKKIAYRAAAVSRYVYLNKPIEVIIFNEVHYGRSLLKMRLKAYVLDIRYEFPFVSEMTEIVIQEFLRAGLITPEQLALTIPPTPPHPGGHLRQKS